MNFFPVPGVANAGRSARHRDPAGAVETGSVGWRGARFAPVFANSTDQMDYRWGKLHRIVVRAPARRLFSIAAGRWRVPAAARATVPGFPTDGGFGAVDASNHDVRAQSCNELHVHERPGEPLRRRSGRHRVRAESVWPGGTSGVLGSPFYVNLLPLWLTNDTIRLLFRTDDAAEGALLGAASSCRGR